VTTADMPRPASTTVGLAEQCLVLTGRNLRGFANRAWVINTAIFPMIFFAGLWVMFGRLLNAHGVASAQALPTGVIAIYMLFSARSGGALIAGDRRSGLLTRLKTMPVHLEAAVLARLLADAVRLLVTAVVVVIAGYVAGFRFTGGAAGAAGYFLVALIFGSALVTAGVAAGIGSSNPEGTMSILQLVNLPLLMFSSALVPTAVFPGWLQQVVRVSPITCAVNAMRGLAAGTQVGSALLWAALWVIGLGLLFGWLTGRGLRKVS
jgi:ABC-2 type transport system permease protein